MAKPDTARMKRKKTSEQFFRCRAQDVPNSVLSPAAQNRPIRIARQERPEEYRWGAWSGEAEEHERSHSGKQQK